MASNREKLLARKKENDARKKLQAETTSQQKTLVDDIVDNLDHPEKENQEDNMEVVTTNLTTSEIEIADDPNKKTEIEKSVHTNLTEQDDLAKPINQSDEIKEEGINTVFNPSEIASPSTEKVIETLQESKQEIKNEINDKTVSESTTAETVVKETIVKAEVPVTKTKKSPKTKEPDYTKYDGGKSITISLTFSEEVNEFFTYRPIELKMTAKQFFKELMIDEIENGQPVNDELAKQYQRTQHDTVKRTIQVTEELREAIKDTAPKYRMRHIAFMAYVLDKARRKVDSYN